MRTQNLLISKGGIIVPSYLWGYIQDAQWMPEITHSTETMYCVFLFTRTHTTQFYPFYIISYLYIIPWLYLCRLECDSKTRTDFFGAIIK